MKNMNESGRSTIELLSVLAIMAVLSIGGIQLYNYGMDTTIAQDTFQEVRKRAITYQERFKNHKYMFEARPAHSETVYGYSIYAQQYVVDAKYIQVTVENVDSNICSRIINKKKNMQQVARLFLNGRAYTPAVTSCPDTPVNMVFLFERKVTDQASDSGLNALCTSDGDCTGCDSCDSNTGVCAPDDSKCTNDSVCVKLSSESESSCHLPVNPAEPGSASDKCGGGNCWVIQEGFCVRDSSLCDEGQICDEFGECSVSD